MFFLLKKPGMAAIAILICVTFTSPVLADACQDAVAKSNAALAEYGKAVMKRSSILFGLGARKQRTTFYCDAAREDVTFHTQIVALKKKVQRVCGSRSQSECNLSCSNKALRESKKRVKGECGKNK